MRLFWNIILSALFACVARGQQGESVNRTPPPIYGASITPFLTPLDEVLDGWKQFPDDTESGVSLLDENLLYTDAEGIRYRLYRQVSWARDEAGAEKIAKSIYRYDKERETIFLVKAEVIRDDGSAQPLDERASFIQTPQHQAANSLYTSKAELSMLFPNVQEGTIVHSIVLIREDTPIFPNEFSTSFGFGGNWPAFREHLHVVQPVEEFARVKAVRTGAGIPLRTVEAIDDGYVHASWKGGQRKATPWETASPGFLFRAPSLRLTTIETWDTIASWFEGLVDGRDALGSALEAEVDTWNEGMTDPMEILEILTEKVANEVRYTGLEFGLAGYQPYPCETVWKNRYGDCKDKANLLRAMLRHKGITAHMVLLDSGGHGLVEKRCPNWYQFNHAITAVELNAGEFIFCDPTIERLPAGRIGIGDAEREVLIVKDGKAIWARTPDTHDSLIRLEIDAKLEPTGAISGWFTLHAEGVDAAYYSNHYAEKDDRDRRRTMQRTLEDFFPGAEVIDAKFEQPKGSVTSFDLRTYFVRSSLETESLTVVFPYPLGWLPDLSPEAERQWSYEIGRRVEGVDATIRLPRGMAPEKLPTAFATSAEHSFFNASWGASEDALHCSLDYAPTRRIFQPPEYAEFHRAVRALATWLETPVTIIKGSSLQISDTPTVPLADFPILSDAEAQLRLIEDRFPEDNGKEDRRNALEKIAQWFPDEVNGVFESKVKLIQLEETDDNLAETAQQFKDLLKKYRPRVSSRNWAWVDFLEARARFYDRKDPAAIQTLLGLAQNTELEPFRRGWSACTAARFLYQNEQVNDALALLKDHDDYACEAQQPIINDESLWHAISGNTERFKEWANEFVASHPTDADRLLSNGIHYVLSNLSDVSFEHRRPILKAWLEIHLGGGHFPEISSAFASVREIIHQSGFQETIADALLPVLKREKPDWWSREKVTSFETTDALIEAVNKNNNGSEVIDGFVQLVFHHEPPYPILVEQMRRAMWYLDAENLEPAVFSTLAQLALKMPESGAPALLGCWRLVAKRAYDEGDIAGARAVYARVMASDCGGKHFVARSADALAAIELAEGDIDAALRAMAVSEQYHSSHVDGGDYLLRQMFLRFERGEFERVEELFTQLKTIDRKYIEGTDYFAQINQVLQMPDDVDQRRAFWTRPKPWIHDWNRILADHGVPALEASEFPLILDIDDLRSKFDNLTKKSAPKPFLNKLRIFEANARWIPRFAIEFGRQVDKATKMPEELRKQLNACVVKMTKNVPPIDESINTDFRIYHLDALENSGRHAEALAEGLAMFEEGGISTQLGSSGLRLWLKYVKGSKTEAKDPTARALAALEAPAEVYKREDLIGQLSDTLKSVDMNSANLKLIERELSDSKSDFKDWRRKALQKRLKTLRNDISGGRAFAEAVNKWIHKNAYEWIENIPVFSIDDARFSEVQGIATESNTPGSDSEILKYNYLLATNPETDANLRDRAFTSVFNLLAFRAQSSGEYRDCVASVLNESAVPMHSRIAKLKDGVGLLCMHGHADQARSLIKLRAAKSILQKNPDLDSPFQRWIRAARALESNSINQLKESALEMIAAPVQHFDVQLISYIIERLIYIGEGENAEKIYEATAKIAFESNYGATRNLAQFRFVWARGMRMDQYNASFFRHARALVLKAHGKPVRRNKLAKSYFNAYRTAWGAREDDIIELYIWMIEGGRLHGSDFFHAFEELFDMTSFGIRHRKAGTALLDFALKAEVPDHVRRDWIQYARKCIDTDVVSTRERCVELLKAFRDNPAHQDDEFCLREVADCLAATDLRSSPEARPETLFSSKNTDYMDASELAFARLRFGVSRAQPKVTAMAWNRVSSDRLTNPFWIPLMIRALTQIDEKENDALLRQCVEEKARKEASDLWLNPFPNKAKRVSLAADVLQLPDLLSEDAYERLLKVHKGSASAYRIRYYYAKSHNNWKQMDRALAGILKTFPERYDLFLDCARVAHRIGKSKNALKDLDIYLQKCRNHPEYAEAVQLKQQIEAER